MKRKGMAKKISWLLSLILVVAMLSSCGSKESPKDENKDYITNEEGESELPDSYSESEVGEGERQKEDINNENLNDEESDSKETMNSENSEANNVLESESSSSQESQDKKPDIQTPSEETQTPAQTDSEASISSSAPGWDKVPSFKGSNLTEKQMAVKIVECIISSSMSDFEKALEIHDWLIFNVDYDHTYSNYHAKNAFVDRSCVCQGYAEAFELMAEAAGLEATFVSGVATNSGGVTESHAWNQVKMNGKWYNVDVTWDDPTHDGKEFNDHSGNRYDYFLVSKAQLEKDHRADAYNEGEKSCPSNYDKVSILKAAANTGRYGDVAVVTNVSEANAGIKKYMDQNKSSMNLWIYDASVTVGTSQAYVQNLTTQLQYIISLSTFYPSNNGIIKCPIGITPSSEWNAIPVVKNVDEFKALLDKNGDAGITTYTVRYESTNGQPELAASEYGFSVSYTTYNNGNSWLINVTIK